MTLPKSPSEAKSVGSKHYYTGKPCSKGHVSFRYTCSAACSDCAREKALLRSKMPNVKAANSKNKKKPEYIKKQKEYAAKKRNSTYKQKPQNIDVSDIKCPKKRAAEYARLYYHANKERIKKATNSADRKRRRKFYIRKWQYDYSKTKKGKAINFMRKSLQRCIGNKYDRTEEVLGYTKEDLVSHIESNFKPGMSWDNYGDWHIDHIVPIVVFIKKGVECPKKINALENLQPLWAIENLSKGDKHEPV